MIAALATGLLGQAQGFTAAAGALSGLSSLLGGKPSASSTAASASASPAQKLAPTPLHSPLDFKLHRLLLDQQATRTGGSIQADDVTPRLDLG